MWRKVHIEPFDEVWHLRNMNLLVFSHLRWNFVFQRPQHLMTRCAVDHRLFFWEEPVFDAGASFVEVREVGSQIRVVVPHLPTGLTDSEIKNIQAALIRELITEYGIDKYSLWYYTPMAVEFTRDLQPQVVIYDCMDELTAFRGAPPGLRAAEAELFAKADLVFTGGTSLYQSKNSQHRAVHCFPSSIDREFFVAARRLSTEPSDQASIPQPRLGYCGVIDERMDLDLLASVSDARPDWHFVMIGPVVKINPSELPQGANIHYLGAKDYSDLPSYLSGWQVGLLPFAQNESTRFISPTKTPEYLAAGLPVVSTPIADVVTPYGLKGLVEIAKTAEEFIAGAERAIRSRNSAKRLEMVDEFLSEMSWDTTWEQMNRLIEATGRGRRVLADDALTSRGNAAAAD